jgi:hypothetical protein
MFCMLCVTFWVVLQRMVFDSRRFGTLCVFHPHRRVDGKSILHPLAYEDGTDTVFRNVGYRSPYAKNNPKHYTRQLMLL